MRFLEKYTFIELYETVIKNRALFDSKLSEYWDIVDSVWIENGRRKLDYLDTCGSLEGIEYGHVVESQHAIAKKLDARQYIGGNELETFAFAWYCAADLIKSTKYFSLPHMSKGSPLVFKINKNGRSSISSDWSHKSVVNMANWLLSDDRGWEKRQAQEIIDDVKAYAGLDIIKEVLPQGFLDFIKMKTLKKPVGAKITKIKNKMDFVIWKKFLKSKTMTQDHFKVCLETRVPKEFWSPFWNEIIKIDGLTDKKYFENYFEKNVSSDYFDGIHPTLATTMLNKITTSDNYPSIFRCVAILENIDFGLGDISYDEFSSTDEFKKYIVNIHWGAFKKGNISKSLFCKDNFLKHLDDIYRN